MKHIIILFRPLLLGVLGLIILVTSIVLTKSNLNINRFASNEYYPPLEVRITNIYETGFSISWVTKEATRGRVVYSKNQNDVSGSDFVAPRVVDQRGDNPYNTHLVNVRDLEIGGRYYFKIMSNDQSYFLSLGNQWRQYGVAESVLLPSNPGWTAGAYSLETDAFSGCYDQAGNLLTSCYRPNIIWGSVKKQDNNPAVDTLVSIEIPGKSSTITTITNPNGQWVINLSNLWSFDKIDYASYMPGIDLIKISCLAKDAKVSAYQPIPYTASRNSQLIPPVLLTLQDAPLVNPEITTTPFPTATTVLPAPVTPIPTITASPTEPTYQSKITLLFRPKNTSGLTGKIELKNSAGQWTSRKATLRKISENHYQGDFSVGQAGMYEIAFQPDGYLKSTLGKYELTTSLNIIENNNGIWVAGDINNDNHINMVDVSLLLANYMKTKPAQTSADLNGDAIINMIDLSLLLKNYL